jgi:hypothetical protein
VAGEEGSLKEPTAMTTAKDSVTARLRLSEEERQLVIGQLARMLASPLFSQSKRYAPFLRHVVQKSLGGEEDSLRERVLGIELFGRAPDYDSNNDPVVRVTAGEVRKRIALYYDDSLHRNEFRIDLPVGTYVAQFHPGPPADEEQSATPESSAVEAGPAASPEPAAAAHTAEAVERTRVPKKPLVAAAVILAVLACAGLAWKFERRTPSALDAIWGNLASPQSATVIAVGEPPPLYPKDNTSEEPSARQHLRDYHISLSDLQALIRIVRLLDHRGIAYRVQPANTTTFADLRQEPAVLLGGLDNSWAMRAQQNLRFRLQTDGNGVDWISDSHDPDARKWSLDFNRPYSKVTTDYAIVAFFRDPGTQQPTLIIAGMGENGTKAASEFITDDAQLHNALGEALRKPGGGNFEVVLTTEVINGSSGAPMVLVKEVW